MEKSTINYRSPDTPEPVDLAPLALVWRWIIVAILLLPVLFTAYVAVMMIKYLMNAA